MSETDDAPGLEAKKVFLRELKDRSLFIGWIAGLVILGVLVWTLSRSFLTNDLMRSVNRSMEADGNAMRVSVTKSLPPFKHAPLGIWYSIRGSNDLLFVFTVFQNGVLSVYGARLTPEYRISEIIPVSAHSRQTFTRLSPGIIEIFTRRIESAAAQWSNNE
jgi:hypothetical protein